jgi:hypothetical protein
MPESYTQMRAAQKRSGQREQSIKDMLRKYEGLLTDSEIELLTNVAEVQRAQAIRHVLAALQRRGVS